MKMMNLTLFMMLAAIFTEGLVTQESRKLFRKASNILGFGNKTYSCQLWTESVLDEYSCGRKCFKNNRCVRFKYEKNGGLCAAYCDRDTDIGVRQGDQTIVYEAVKGIGHHCTNSRQCVIPHSTCNNGVCTCEFGYIYIPDSETCVNDCGQDGSAFTLIRNRRIKGFYLSTMFKTTIASCMSKCKATLGCRSFAIKPLSGYCRLNKAGWFEAAPDQRLIHYGTLFYQKYCNI